MDIKKRVYEIREALSLSQEAFGKRIGVGRSAVSNYESGGRNITDQVIRSIIREFDVSAEWLKNGQGEMFIKSDTFSLDEFVKKQGMSELELNIVKCYFELDPEIRQAVVSHFKERLFNKDSEIAATVVNKSLVEDPIEEEVNAYRLELEAEKKGRILSVSEDIDGKAN